MDEYIKKSEAIKAIRENPSKMAMYTVKAICAIEDLPSADVVPKSEVDELRKSVSKALEWYAIESKKVEKLQKQLAPFREKQCFTCLHHKVGCDHMPCYVCRDYDKYEWLGDAELKKKYTEGEQ